MRSLFLISLGFIFISLCFRSHPSVYIADVSNIEYFIVIENGIEDTINTNPPFKFRCHNPSKTYIRLESDFCDDSEKKDTISLRLWGKKENGFTSNMEVKLGQNISIKYCFDNFLEQKGFFSSRKSLKDKILIFLGYASKSKITCGRSNTTMAGKISKSHKPKLQFIETDNSYFYDLENLHLHFDVHKDHPITSLYIIPHGNNHEFVFWAGDTSLVSGLPILDGKTIPDIKSIIQQTTITKDSIIHNNLNTNNIRDGLLNEIIPGRKYQLGIKVSNDDPQKTYLFNFFLLTQKDKEIYKDFLENE